MPLPKNLLIEVSVELRDIEPDGSECDICGDVIFLTGKEMVFVSQEGMVIGKMYYKFCQSCGDMLESEMNSEGGVG